MANARPAERAWVCANLAATPEKLQEWGDKLEILSKLPEGVAVKVQLVAASDWGRSEVSMSGVQQRAGCCTLDRLCPMSAVPTVCSHAGGRSRGGPDRKGSAQQEHELRAGQVSAPIQHVPSCHLDLQTNLHAHA